MSEDLPYTAGEKVSLILPRISAALVSFLACCGTAVETWGDHRKGCRSVVSRTQFVLQFPLFGYYIAYMVGSNASPQGSPLWGAWGTVATCEEQGALVQVAVLSFVPLDMFISAVMILIFRYNWTEIKLRRVEKWVHIVMWPFVVAGTVIPGVLKLHNTSWERCWLDEVPSGCHEQETAECSTSLSSM